MAAYLTLDEFKDLSLMPSEQIDELEVADPGWIEGQLLSETSWLNTRLAKRYDAPFASPYPDAVKGWLAKIVSYRAMVRRGFDPLDPQGELYKADHDEAKAEVLEAANSETGLYELPKSGGTASGVSRGGPYAYSEASPYVWTDRQRATGAEEDRTRDGTHG